MAQPSKTLKLFVFAVFQHLQHLLCYVVGKSGLLVFSISIILALCLLVVKQESLVKSISRSLIGTFGLEYGGWLLDWHPQLALEKNIKACFQCNILLLMYSARSTGQDYTPFFIYLGPHIALFTIKAMQYGRVDLKSAPYDTIQFESGPSWLEKDSSEFGPQLFTQETGLLFSLRNVLPQVQVESIIWGIGTVFGEVPPYFISRAARLSGSANDAMQELDVLSTEQSGLMTNILNQIMRQFLAHSQYLNLFAVLALASMIFIISICNYHFLDWMENKLIWALIFVPSLDPIFLDIVAKVHSIRDKFLGTTPPTPSGTKKWGVSLGAIWNTVVLLILINFFATIIAKIYLKKQQEKELEALNKRNCSQ